MKEILLKYKWQITTFLCVLSIGILLGRCSTQKERSQNTANLKASRDSIEAYQIVVGSLDLLIKQKDAMILSKDEAISAGIIEREYLKKLHLKELITNTDLKGEIKILQDSLKKQPGTIIIHIKDSLDGSYVKIPFTLLNLKEKYVNLSAGMNLDGTSWFDLNIPFNGTVTVGYQKSGFLKTKPVGIFSSDNYYLKINNMDVVVVADKKKFYQKTWFHIAVGAVGIETLHQILK
jgi:hypothetical protein